MAIVLAAQTRYAMTMPITALARALKPSPSPSEISGRTSVVKLDIESPSVELNIDTNESYTISIDGDGVCVHSHNVYGSLRALETLSQLLEPRDTPEGPAIKRQLYVRWLNIHDYPRFPYRGIMIDTVMTHTHIYIYIYIYIYIPPIF